MAATRIKDAVVITGTYKTRDGEEKKRYQTVGSIIRWDDGGESLLLDRTFNPAGMPGEGAVAIRFYDPKPREGQGGFQPASTQAAPKAAPAGGDPFLDDIPFAAVTGPW